MSSMVAEDGFTGPLSAAYQTGSVSRWVGGPLVVADKSVAIGKTAAARALLPMYRPMIGLRGAPMRGSR